MLSIASIRNEKDEMYEFIRTYMDKRIAGAGSEVDVVYLKHLLQVFNIDFLDSLANLDCRGA